MRNYASNLMRSEKVEKSNALIRRVWELMPVYREKMAVTHAILVENFLYLRQLDSAAYYLDMAWQAEAKAEQQSGVNISTRLLLYELQNVVDYAMEGSISRRLEPDGLAIPLSWQIGTSRAPYSNRWIQKLSSNVRIIH